jgi:lantibiotic transport system permease protein
MKSLWTSLQVETLKTRKTLALMLTAIAPAVIVIVVSGFYIEHASFYKPSEGENAWVQFSQMNMVYWTLLMLPLFITLESALLAQLEHSHQNWKMIYAQPLPRWTIYAAKLITLEIWMALCNLELIAMIVIAGKVLQWIHPAYGLDAPVPWGSIVSSVGLAYLASGFMISFHLWVGTRWNSFVVATGVGFVAAILTGFIFGEDFAYFFPWALPGVITMDLDNSLRWVSMAIGSLGGGLMAFAGGWDILRRDVL